MKKVPFFAITDLEDLLERDFRTPDDATGKPFTVKEKGRNQLTVTTSRGGRVKIQGHVFDTMVKVLEDYGCTGDNWMRANDSSLKDLSKSLNSGIACLSYVLPLLEAAGLVEIDGSRPNKVRLTKERSEAAEK